MFFIRYWNQQGEEFRTHQTYRNRPLAKKASKALKAAGLAKRFRIKKFKKNKKLRPKN